MYLKMSVKIIEAYPCVPSMIYYIFNIVYKCTSNNGGEKFDFLILLVFAIALYIFFSCFC